MLDRLVHRPRLLRRLAEPAHAGQSGALRHKSRMGTDGNTFARERFDEAGGEGTINTVPATAQRVKGGAQDGGSVSLVAVPE